MKIIYGIEAYYVNDADSLSVVRGRSTEPLTGTFIVFDLETTGLNPANEEITEIAAVRMVEGEIRDSFQTYVNPHMPIPAEITELTGISDETVADAPDLDEAVPKFLAWAGRGSILSSRTTQASIWAFCGQRANGSASSGSSPASTRSK